jgi:ATP-dependent DNA helicase DinG
MINNLLHNFPNKYVPTDNQRDLLERIDQAYADGYKYVVCSAPTGTGKSFLSKTLANSTDASSDEYCELVDSYEVYKRNGTGGYLHEDKIQGMSPFGAFALTITKTLQDQYKELFPDTMVLKGKSNYQCTYDTDFTVDTAPCIYTRSIQSECWRCNSCPYFAARNRALTSSFSALNYNMFFSLPDHVKRRKFIICDEASELEDQLVKIFSCSVRFDILKRSNIKIRPLPKNAQHDKIRRWLGMLSEDIGDRIEDLNEIINTRKIDTASPLKIKDYKKELIIVRDLQSKIRTVIETWSECEYIVERNSDNITFTPLRVNNLASQMFEHAEKVLLMSATIIDVNVFCKSLGIEPTEFKYIEAKSSFPAKKAPIYVSGKTKLNHFNLKKMLPTILKQVNQISEHHKNDKGIIHTHSNAITNYLRSNIKDKRFLFREPGVRNEDLLDIHLNTDEPTILVSPSMSHGVDLKDDLARFQVIVKAPYLPLGDERIKRLAKNNFDWYQDKMMSAFIQACGRGVRSKDDFCATYVLDRAVADVVIRNTSKMPKYFLDRFV